MEYLTSMISASDVTSHAAKIRDAIDKNETLGISTLTKSKVVDLTRDASILLAYGTAVAEGRTALIIDNLDNDVAIALLADSETDVTNALAYVMPGERMIISFASDSTAAIYGRSTGYSVSARVREV